MRAIRDELDAFLRGETDLDGLLASIDRALIKDPAGVSAFMAEVRGLYNKGRLPAQLLSVFEHRVQTASQRLGASHSVSPQGPSADTEGSARPASGAVHGDASGQWSAAPSGSPSTPRTGGGSQSYSQGSGAGPSGYSTATVSYPPEPEEPVVGQVLKDRFELVELLGRGGMSVVFKALDRRKVEALDRHPYVALKLLSSNFRRNPHSLQTLQREARRAQNLSHPNVINIYDFDKDEHGNYFIAMELLSGSPLDKVIRELRTKGGMDLASAYSLIERMGLALAAGHKQKPPLVHSDFKPGNVFLTDDGEIKVFDFGIARAARPKGGESPGEMTNFDAGVLGALTPMYASLEMLASGDPDPRDDIYALAIVAYELLTGKRPFGRKTTALQAMASGLSPPRIKGLSRRQWNALRRALAFERERRTPNVEELLEELRPRRSHALWYAASATLAAAGVLAWYLLQEGETKERGEREILAEVETAEPQRLAELAEEAAGLSADGRTRIYAQVAERYAHSLLAGDSSRAADVRQLIEGSPEPVRQAVHAELVEDMASRLAEAGADGAGAIIDAADTLPDDYRRDLYARAKTPILAWFKDEIRRRFDPTRDRYDYAGARAALERAAARYPDSLTVDEMRADLDAERERAAGQLDARLARLAAAGRLLTDGTPDTVPAALGYLLEVDPQRRPAARASLVRLYVEGADTARRQGDLAKAASYVETGMRLFPDDPGLQEAKGQLDRLIVEQRTQQAVEDLRARVRERLPGVDGPRDRAVIADELEELARRSPADPLLARVDERLAQGLDRRLAPLLVARSWAAGNALIDDYAAVLSPVRLAAARDRLSAAQAQAEAERRAQEEAEQQAQAERRAREEADRQAQQEAERRAREEAGHQAREAAKGQAPQESERASALAYWDLIKDTGNVAAVRAFLDRFQDPVLRPLAQQRLAELEAEASGQTPARSGGGEALPGADTGGGLSPHERQDALQRAAEVPPQLIQQALKDLGYYDGPADGKLGPASERAIRGFQRARGAPQTGTLSNAQVLALVRTAAEAGHPASQNTFAMMAAEGVGIPQSPETAVRWFQAAADQGNAYAAYNLGVLYREGRGVDASVQQARRYFEKARAGGHPQATSALAELAAGASTQVPEAGAVRAPASELPAHLVQQALGDVGLYSGTVDGLVGPGTRQAIRAYQASRGEPQTGELSGEQIVALVRQAAAAGYPKSENTLGMMAAEGVGVSQNAREAFHWFKSAAEKGDPYAAYNLAVLYRDGRGVASSIEDARKYFEAAAAGGHPQAAQALKELDE